MRFLQSFALFGMTVYVLTFSTPALACTNPVGVAGDMTYNDDFHVMQWCDGTNWNAVGQSPYIPNAVYFDGASWLGHVPALTGVSPYKQLTGSLWVRNLDADSRFLNTSGNTFIIDANGGTDGVRIVAENSGGTDVLAVRSSDNVVPQDGPWTHILFSFDLTNPANRHLYINGVSDLNTVNTYTDDFASSVSNLGISSVAAGGGARENQMADVWIDFGTYLDLSDVNIRRQFIDANGWPVDLGADGSRPTGSAPDIFLSGDTATWHTNDGTGGGFTENGALTDATSHPAEEFGPMDGLVGWWKLDETAGTTATDSSGNGNDGTMNGGLDASNDSLTGIIADGLGLDGVNDYIDINSTSVGPTNTITFTAWVKATNPTSGWQGIIFNRSGVNVAGLNLRDTTGQLGYHWNNEVGAWNYASGLFVPLNEWAFVAVVVEPTQARLYLGDVSGLSSAINSFAHVNQTFNALLIGEDVSAGGRHFDGVIDDVRIYNRALSPAEITEIYDSGYPCKNPTAQREGDTVYNYTHHVIQYCNNREWKAMSASPGDGGPDVRLPQGCPTIGDTCDDGTIYAGLSPDGNEEMYMAPLFTIADLPWNDGNFGGLTLTSITNVNTGEANTTALIGLDSDSSTGGVQPHQAAQYCADFTYMGAVDWYLPASVEIENLYNGGSPIGGLGDFRTFWTSTEQTNQIAYSFRFDSGAPAFGQFKYDTSPPHYALCVRKGPAPRCSNPNGVPGSVMYNSTSGVMQYCEGDTWRAIGRY